MVFVTLFIGAFATLARSVSASPMHDSPAPYGTVLSNTADRAVQTGTTSPSSGYASSYGGSSSGAWTSTSVAPAYTTPAYTAAAYTTTTAAASYSTPSYGSGSSNWGSGYNNCVQQCVAQFGAPSAATTTPPSTYTPPTSTSSGSGATHTVIVSPAQGILRYVPFALNASVGDTIKFVWQANVHTVTKSSALTPCNKTADAPFASGSQNKSFVFEQVINNTDTTFYYCGTPTHCQKGMFGIINPPSATGPTSMGGMMPSLAANDSSMAAMLSYTNNQTSGSVVAASWGGNIDLSSVPSWSYSLMAQNVMYNRVFLANNPDVISADGSIDLSSAGSTPLMIPGDITAAVVNSTAASTPSASATATSTPSPSSSSTPLSSTSTGSSSGASSLGSPRVLIVLMVAVATLFAL